MSYLITFEGIDGSGKTTQIKLLEEFVSQNNRLDSQSYLFTKNPGGTIFGQKVRQWLLEDQEIRLGNLAELFLYLSDRAEHFEKVIENALEKGKTVICDRFTDSSVAYQSLEPVLPKKLVQELNLISTKNRKPDFTFLFDLEPEISLARAARRPNVTGTGPQLDKIEQKGLDFIKQVRLNFLEQAQAEPDRFVLLEIKSKSAQEIQQLIIERLRSIGVFS